jgi:hypothetical protein
MINEFRSTLITVFFFGVYPAHQVDFLFPFCKLKFSRSISNQLIDFAFIVTYYIGALLLFILAVS